MRWPRIASHEDQLCGCQQCKQDRDQDQGCHGSMENYWGTGEREARKQSTLQQRKSSSRTLFTTASGLLPAGTPIQRPADVRRDQNRHVVGNERVLQERRVANPSWPRVLQMSSRGGA